MMRIAALVAFAGLAAASSPTDQATLAPGAKSQEMKDLLALDSFNVTSSDAEQNRMHAVCDMEYRLSNKLGMNKKGLGISSFVATSPQLPFNPFTMPLAAVKSHIALLEQQRDYLQAQSDAFDGSSSSSSTSDIGLTVSALTRINTVASGGTQVAGVAATASSAVTDTHKLSFTTTGAIPKDYSIYFTLVATTDAIVSDGTADVMTIVAADEVHCWDKRATADSDSDDGKCKLEDGTTTWAPAYAQACTSACASTATVDVAAATWSAAQSGGDWTAVVGGGSGTYTFPNTAKALRFMYKMPTTQGLRPVTGGEWYLPQGTRDHGIAAAVKVTMDIMDSTGTIVTTGSATSTY